MGSGTLRPIAFLVFVVFAAVILHSSEGSEAADIDYYGDWVISGSIVQETDKTIDVRGNVVIQSGGVLKLYSCTLDINASANGQYSIEVQSGGRLEAYDSVIRGYDAYVDFYFRDAVVLEGCTLSHVNGVQSGGGVRGIMVTGGPVSMTDTTVTDCRYHGIYAQADLNLDNVTIEDVENSNLYMTNWGASGDFTVSIRDSSFDLASGGGWYKAGVYFGRWGGDPDMDLTVTGSTFHDGTLGVYITGGSNSDVVVDDCTFTDCVQGISMSGQTSSGDYTLSNNHMDAGDLADSVGLILTFGDGFAPVLMDNVVVNANTGYSITGPWSGSASGAAEGLVVDNCTRGLLADRNLALTVSNSTFTGITGPLQCFIADNGATITIRDTEHPWGSGTVNSGSSWIRAHTDIGILGAKWSGGSPIASGELVMENLTQYEVARFNLSDVRSQDMVGWEVTSTGSRTSLYLYPAMYVEGHAFRGDRIDLRTYHPSIIELVDDYVPSMTIDDPADGSGSNVTTVVTDGTMDELGSGMDMIEFSLDGGAFQPLTTWTGGTWSLILTSLGEGEHDLSLRPRDKVGNMGEEVSVHFWVDTVVPFIDVLPYEGLVNTSTIMLEGSTEPGVSMKVNGVPVELTVNGTFSVELPVSEGDNAFSIVVEDRAGNWNITGVQVERDMTLPTLTITSPEPDVWTNIRTTYAEGTAEDGTTLMVNGEEVEVVNGSYRKRINLEEGDFTVLVTCTDSAGNTAVRSRLVHVDWTAPELIVVEPESAEVYVRESTVYISGDVDDPTIDHVMVNDQSIALTNGRFVKQFTVLEGVTDFVISTSDEAGNSVTQRIVVIRDLTPPTYEWNMTAIGGDLLIISGDQYCTASAVEVYITTSELASFSLGGGSTLSTGTEVRHRFDLVEGTNTLEVYIVDVAGNQAQTFRQRVDVDTTAPTIDVQSPQPGFRTKEDTVTIHGFTEVGTSLTLNGETVNVLTGGEFRHIVALVDGRNEFTLEVSDAMGNSATASLSVLRETDVTTGDDGTGGSTMTGFIMGLVVGIVLMLAFMFVRSRGQGPDRERPAGPAPPEPSEPFHAPSDPDKGPSGGGEGGWEEY